MAGFGIGQGARVSLGIHSFNLNPVLREEASLRRTPRLGGRRPSRSRLTFRRPGLGGRVIGTEIV